MLFRRFLKHTRSNLIAYVALFFALSGTAAYAKQLAPTNLVRGFCCTVFSSDIVDGQVFSVDVADNSLAGVDVLNGGLFGADIADSSLTGSDVATGSIFSSDIANGAVTGTDVADGSLTGTDVLGNSLTGLDIAENTLSVAGMGCQSGKVLGFARIMGTAGIPSFYTSSSPYISIANNCAGPAPQVRRLGVGWYHVKFPSNPAALALATPNADGFSLDSTNNDNIITVGKFTDAVEGTFFRVEVQDVCGDCSGGADFQDGNFIMVLP
jgi:hypothetical protein